VKENGQSGANAQKHVAQVHNSKHSLSRRLVLETEQNVKLTIFRSEIGSVTHMLVPRIAKEAGATGLNVAHLVAQVHRLEHIP